MFICLCSYFPLFSTLWSVSKATMHFKWFWTLFWPIWVHLPLLQLSSSTSSSREWGRWDVRWCCPHVLHACTVRTYTYLASYPGQGLIHLGGGGSMYAHTYVRKSQGLGARPPHYAQCMRAYIHTYNSYVDDGVHWLCVMVPVSFTISCLSHLSTYCMSLLQLPSHLLRTYVYTRTYLLTLPSPPSCCLTDLTFLLPLFCGNQVTVTMPVSTWSSSSWSSAQLLSSLKRTRSC